MGQTQPILPQEPLGASTEMTRLKEQLAALTEEKNALLDYIEENGQGKTIDNTELVNENTQLRAAIE